eukprot:4681661-Pleurochrysis_carterae.AAC.1
MQQQQAFQRQMQSVLAALAANNSAAAAGPPARNEAARKAPAHGNASRIADDCEKPAREKEATRKAKGKKREVAAAAVCDSEASSEESEEDGEQGESHARGKERAGVDGSKRKKPKRAVEKSDQSVGEPSSCSSTPAAVRQRRRKYISWKASEFAILEDEVERDERKEQKRRRKHKSQQCNAMHTVCQCMPFLTLIAQKSVQNVEHR